jgi:ASC-1-like (ASCH) protein
MEHSLRLSNEPFGAIKEGKKVIESRLYDEKRQLIKIGDCIIFSENDSPENTIKTKVIGLLRYQFFKDLFADHDPKLFGGTDAESLLMQIKSFYSDEEEEKFGVIGIRLQVLIN